MTSIQRTLLIIAVFLLLGIGSFIWYVASWEAGQPSTLGAISAPTAQTASLFSDLKNPGVWGSAPVLHPQHAGRIS